MCNFIRSAVIQSLYENGKKTCARVFEQGKREWGEKFFLRLGFFVASGKHLTFIFARTPTDPFTIFVP